MLRAQLGPFHKADMTQRLGLSIISRVIRRAIIAALTRKQPAILGRPATKTPYAFIISYRIVTKASFCGVSCE